MGCGLCEVFSWNSPRVIEGIQFYPRITSSFGTISTGCLSEHVGVSTQALAYRSQNTLNEVAGSFAYVTSFMACYVLMYI